VRGALAGTGTIHNAGVDGDHVENVLRRLDDVSAARPTHVVVLIGTNDTLWPFLRRYKQLHIRLTKGLRLAPSPERCRSGLTEIVRAVAGTTGARVAVCALPPIGENGSDGPARAVEAANRIIADICRDSDAAFLPVHDALVALRERANPGPGPSFGGDPMLARAAVGRALLRRSFDACAAAEGFVALSDGVHLSDMAADEVAVLVTEWIERTGAHPSR
jgi:lysophospholipase L1-like esterase